MTPSVRHRFRGNCDICRVRLGHATFAYVFVDGRHGSRRMALLCGQCGERVYQLLIAMPRYEP